MEVLILLLLVTVVVMVINQNSKLSDGFKQLEKELKLLRRQLQENSSSKEEQNTVAEKPEPYVPSFINKPKETAPPPQQTQEVPLSKPAEVPLPAIPRPPAQKAAAKPGFFERNPDLEKFIGENLVSKIGIAVLVLAIGFFVKYAIDQNWIGPAGRVSIGILCGGVLVGVAHRLRTSYKSFSSVLAGGGLAVFYFTITLAFHQFHLFSQLTAFIIMLFITLFAVLLALLYSRQELAIIALLGGFTAPFLVSTGEGNYITLFIYLVVLNTGLLAIAYNKAWRLLNLLSFILTVLLFSSWLFFGVDKATAITYRNGFIFAVIFYLLFFVINIAHNVKEKKKFIASDFGILLANTALFFGAGIYCLTKMNAFEWRGGFSAALGIFNLAASRILFRRQKVDTNILFLLIGITLTFISITAPIQLHGNNITLFWASEAVLLYWLFLRSKINIIQYSSLLVWIMMLVSLLMDIVMVYLQSTDKLSIIINKGFITTLYSAAATYCLFLLRRKKATPGITGKGNIMPGATTFRISALALLFITGLLEINYQFLLSYPKTSINVLYLLLYIVSFIAVLLIVTQNVQKLAVKSITAVALMAVAIGLYLMSLPNIFTIQQEILLAGKNGAIFFAHWIMALLILVFLYQLIILLRKRTGSPGIVTWIICIAIVIFFSSELLLLGNTFFYGSYPLASIKSTYIKTVLPILWGLCSFAFMWTGMHFKNKTLRIISLSLFTLTLLKLFIFDIRDISAGGKIAAFFCLGILLLVVSFMYQRLKKIIIDEEKLD